MEKEKIKDLMLKVDYEYHLIVKEILENDEFKKRMEYKHHENRSVYTHSLMVSIQSYKIAKKLKLDYKSAAIGGLLHDFYYEDWQITKRSGIKNMHGFVHSKEALENSKKHFENLMNKRIEDIIEKHMFPLTIRPPKYKESFIINLVDKRCSLEVFKYPKELYKYIGLKKKK